jgi:hypothetical protein
VTSNPAYSTPGAHPFQLLIVEARGTAVTLDGTLNVLDNAPFRVQESRLISAGTLATYFYNPDPETDALPAGVSATVDWGDGTTSQGTLEDLGLQPVYDSSGNISYYAYKARVGESSWPISPGLASTRHRAQ